MYMLNILEKKVKRERRIMYHIYQQLLPHHSCSGTDEMAALHEAH